VRNDTAVVAAAAAYGFYKRHSAYVCQGGRSFRDVHYVAFYRDKRIMPLVPRITDWRDHVPFTRANADRLLEAEDERDRILGAIVWNSILEGSRYDGDLHEVLMLTPPNDDRTVRLERAIRHEGAGPWTRGQRYTSIEALQQSPRTTTELEGLAG
jgi:hypothetical protein